MAINEKVYSVRFEIAKPTRALEKFNRRLERTDKLFRKMRANGTKLFRGLAKELGRVDTALVSTERKTKKLGKTALNTSKQFEKASKRSAMSLRKIGAGASQLGGTFTRRLTLPITVAGIASLKFARDFNKGLANVGTLLDGGTEKLEGLKASILEVSAKTGKPLTDLTDGLYQVVSALGDTSESMGQLDVAAKGAVAGVATTEESISLLSGVMNAYNETSVESMKATSDLAFTAVKLGVTTYPKLAASMGKVTPLAAAMGTTQAELFATMATGTKVGTETAEVATQVASVYSAMLKPTDALKKVTKKLGFESATAMMKEKGFRGTLVALNEAVDGNETKMAGMLKRKEANLIATVLLGGQSENYTKILGEMQKSVGATDEAYKRQTEGINKQGFQWEKTKQRMVAFGVKMGDKLLPVLERLFKKLEPVLDYLENMDDATLELGLKIAGALAIIGPGLKIFGGLATAFGGVKSAIGGVLDTSAGLKNFFKTQSGAATGLTTKMGLLARSIGAVAAAAGVGVAIGTAISEAFVDPAIKGSFKDKDKEEDLIRRADDVIARGTAADKDKLYQDLVAEKSRLETDGSLFRDQTIHTYAVNRKLRELNNQDPVQPSLDRDFATQSINTMQTMGRAEQGQSRQSSNISIGPTSFVVNAPGGDAKAIRREVEKGIAQEGKKLRRAAAGIGAGEQ